MTQRYAAVDALRGLIMILMAIDHASAFIARQHGAEFWAGAMSAYDSAFPFVTRLVTHLCAPGFFFLMGAGIYWFAASRRKAGWTDGEIARRTALRGLALFAAAQAFEAPMMLLQQKLPPAKAALSRITAPPPNDGTDLYWGFITLTGLGLVMAACAGLLKLPVWMWPVAAGLCLFATNSLLPASGQPEGAWRALLLAPGISEHVLVIYPVIPWLAAAAAGMYFGWRWRERPESGERMAWAAGATLLVAGIALRAAGGWGNIRLPRDGSWIEFLNNVKYPPSAVFLALAIGVDLLLLGALSRAPRILLGERSPLIVFGQTPLFFYLAHFSLLAALAFGFFGEPGTLGMAYAMWAVALAALYPVCAWYRRFKSARPLESFWRLF